MKLPRDLSGDELARLLCRDWNYRQVNQVGSNIIPQIIPNLLDQSLNAQIFARYLAERRLFRQTV
jgi:hypothetical protein